MWNKKLLTMMTVCTLISACSSEKKSENPFFTDYKTPYKIPPFEQIKHNHYLPAFKKGIEQVNREIEAIISNSQQPTFENTIIPYNFKGELLTKVSNVFFNLNETEKDEKMQEIAQIVYPMVSEAQDNILMNQKLFKRVKTIYDSRSNQNYNQEQLRVIEKIYSDFIRSGANLDEKQRARLKEINSRLATLQQNFGNNMVAETNTNFLLVIDNMEELAGLPEPIIEAAAETAHEMNYEGKWVFTLQKPSWIPFLQYSENRKLREKIYRAYFMRGNNNDAFDNKEIIIEQVTLSAEKAEILGFETYAQYIIDENMAKTPENVTSFLMNVWTPALKRAKQELSEMQKIVDKSSNKYKIESWDWWNVAEKLRKEKYDLDESELKPYFELTNVRDGMFWVATKLFGITFESFPNTPKYNTDNDVFEIFEADGIPIGILYLDYHPRNGKGAGAWCTAFQEGTYSKTGERIHPIISIVCNFTKPTAELPSLLTWDEVETLFHEFGHALHFLFADGNYRRTAGDVPRDFVELPSQIMENWASEPLVLKQYARHWKTDEVIPDHLIQKIVNSQLFNQGFSVTEIVAASLLDMEWFLLKKGDNVTDVIDFENTLINKIGLIPEIIPRYRSTYFSHIFGGSYMAGYYVYLWAEVLVADAFAAFVESGDIFNRDLATKFRKYCLSEVGNDDPMTQYQSFRGKKLSENHFLKKRGLQ